MTDKPSPSPSQELARAFEDLGRTLGEGLTRISLVMQTGAALAALLDGDRPAAREALDGLDRDNLDRVKSAAIELAALADEQADHNPG